MLQNPEILRKIIISLTPIESENTLHRLKERNR